MWNSAEHPEHQRRCVIPAKKQITAPANPTEQTRDFAIEAARLAADTHCQNVVILDLRGLSQVTDYFVLATGTSARQMRSVSDEIVELGKERKFHALERSGYEGESWILTDFVDVILHIFDPAARTYYDLDNLWGDATKVSWQRPGAGK
jgi:ribosome-associated protein